MPNMKLISLKKLLTESPRMCFYNLLHTVAQVWIQCHRAALKQRLLLNNFLLSKNEQDTSQKWCEMVFWPVTLFY